EIFPNGNARLCFTSQTLYFSPFDYISYIGNTHSQARRTKTFPDTNCRTISNTRLTTIRFPQLPYPTAEILGMLNLFAKTELGRILVTLVTIVLTVLVVKFLQKRARMQGASDIARQRRNLVLAKNLVLVTAVILIGATWASKIAGAALSLAAVAG